jgi:hypothetical protein
LEKQGNKEIIATWTKIYKKYFKRKIDLTDVTIPTHYDPEKHFCVIVAKGITMNEVVKGLKKLFTVYFYVKDFDARVTTNDRIADKDYAILFDKNIESDEEFKNFSVNGLREEGINGITLLERLLLEIFYLDAAGKHLDVSNFSLCPGSLYFDGGVPSIYWGRDFPGIFVVGWYHPKSFIYDLRVRVAV